MADDRPAERHALTVRTIEGAPAPVAGDYPEWMDDHLAEVFGDDRPIEREPINIHVILDRVKLLARNGVAKGITFHEEYDPSLPPVGGNRDQLIQVFLNLVKNAAEALERTPKPEIRFSTAFRPGIRISVQGVS